MLTLIRQLCTRRRSHYTLNAIAHTFSYNRNFLAISAGQELLSTAQLYDSAIGALRFYSTATKRSLIPLRPVTQFQKNAPPPAGSVPSLNPACCDTHVSGLLAAYYLVVYLFAGRTVAVDVLTASGRFAQLVVRDPATLGDVHAAACSIFRQTCCSIDEFAGPRAGFVCPGGDLEYSQYQIDNLLIGVSVTTECIPWMMKLKCRPGGEKLVDIESSFDPETLSDLIAHVHARVTVAPHTMCRDVTLS